MRLVALTVPVSAPCFGTVVTVLGFCTDRLLA